MTTPSPREVRESNAHAHLIDLLPENLADGVRNGTLEVLPGKNPAKPVVRDATSKAVVKGSGQYPKAPDGAEVGKRTGYKKRTEYREAMQMFMPVLANVDPNDRDKVTHAFEDLLDTAWLAAQGHPTRVECEHKEADGSSCTVKHTIVYKADGNLLWRMIENFVGKATETKEVDIRAEVLQQIAERRVVEFRMMGGVSDEQHRRRVDIIAAAGLADIESGDLRTPEPE